MANSDISESSTPPEGPPPLVRQNAFRGLDDRSQIALAIGEHVEDMKEIVHDQLQEELYESLYTNLFNELSSLFEESRRDMESRLRNLEQALGQVTRTPLASRRMQ